MAATRDSQLLTMFREAARWIPTAGGMSNSWVVSGERTTTGRPILCNDPHLVPGDAVDLVRGARPGR